MKIALTLCLVLVSPPAFAANELTNGDFDTDVSGWSTVDPASYSWDPLDVDASPSSGSLLLKTTPGMMSTDFHGADSECVSVSPGSTLEVAAWTYIPSAQNASVPQAAVGLRRFTAPDCHPLDSYGIEPGVITDLLDQWVELSFLTDVPASVESVSVYVQARNAVGGNQGPTDAYFDAVYLPEPARPASELASALLLAVLARRRRAC